MTWNPAHTHTHTHTHNHTTTQPHTHLLGRRTQLGVGVEEESYDRSESLRLCGTGSKVRVKRDLIYRQMRPNIWVTHLGLCGAVLDHARCEFWVEGHDSPGTPV